MKKKNKQTLILNYTLKKFEFFVFYFILIQSKIMISKYKIVYLIIKGKKAGFLKENLQILVIIDYHFCTYFSSINMRL